MNITLVAGRYATALFEIAKENKILESINHDMAAIKKLFTEAPLIREYCFRKKKSQQDDKEFINTAFIPYVSPITQRTIQLIVQNGRLSSLPYLPQAFEEIRDKNQNLVTIDIESSHEISESELNSIKQKMEKKIQKQIKIRKRILPELLGGFRIIWQNKILDYSAKGRLKQIRHEILDQSK